jgi:hypothetical protein
VPPRRPLEDRRDHGVQHRVQRFDPLDSRRDQFGRADLAGAHQLGLGGGVEQREFIGHGRASSMMLNGAASAATRRTRV